MNREKVILVNAKSHNIGGAEKIYTHRKGLLNRAFSIFILRKKLNSLKLFLQKRAFSKYHRGGLSINSFCVHPRPGEETKNAAVRRLFEELRVVIELKEIDTFIYKKPVTNNLVEYEYDHLFIGNFQGELLFFNPEEVAEVAWFSLSYIKEKLIKEPKSFTAWFFDAFDLFLKKIEEMSEWKKLL